MSSSASSVSSESILGQSALSQILANQKKHLSDREKWELVRKLETSPVNRGKGLVSVDDVYSLLKLQNGVDCTKVELRKLFNELDLDRESRVSLHEFIHTPIISEAVFAAMDKNKDGFISMGELKLAQKNISMRELSRVMRGIDQNHDGKLTYNEVGQIMAKRSTSSMTGNTNNNSTITNLRSLLTRRVSK